MKTNCRQAWKLLKQYAQGDGLIKHALAVESAMRAHARSFGEDEEKWTITGLLHDFDYEQNSDPKDHPLVARPFLSDWDIRKI